MKIQNINEQHKESLSFSEKLALKITNAMGTMLCVWVFTGIGIGSLVGVFTNNTYLALLFGSVSSYLIQLVSLPLIMIGQNLQQRHAELRAENDYDVNLDADIQIKALRQDVKDIKYLLKVSRRK